ncbi:growth factor receptor-bound protein 10-like isoform X3 [Pollicipes pollicipes]|uniref:growth factor receptor-bound protein 10-like isoform X3 n=1 Tax=Pollicipes pollicipes TaxID=41117 RepID=UPI0018859CCA|nr:growth factor receptor-bound protein 10-like isoform X3 [Pollicipes pollicipes]
MTACLGRTWEHGYNHLADSCNSLDANGSDDEATDLVVYNEDGTCKMLTVAEGLRTCDLCELLTLKNHVAKNVNWSLVERWQSPAIERTVEDHEDVLNTYRSMRMAHSSSSFYFKKDFAKYEFFHNPQEKEHDGIPSRWLRWVERLPSGSSARGGQFFPDNMIELPNGKSSPSTTSLARIIALQNLLTTSAPTPQVFGWLWLAGPESRVWRRAYFWLRHDCLYYTMEAMDDSPVRDPEKFAVFAHLQNYAVYGCSDARRDFKAPCDEAVILRTGQQLRCLACDDLATRRCWQTALRVAKYGKQLHENYNFQRIQHENEQSSSPRERYCYSTSPKMPIPRSRTLSNAGLQGGGGGGGAGGGGGSLPRASSVRPAEYDSVRVPNQSMRSLVAMDFTGSCGRVVSDPVEAKAIELAEGHHLRRTNALKRLSELASGSSVRDIEGAIHTMQPWFHGTLNREEASQLLHKHNGRDGVFLVRESRSNPVAFVLSFAYRMKLYHAQIMPVKDTSQTPPTCYYSLDGGKTRFYDLLQLVEFYQLNSGVLPTRLVFFITHATPAASALRHVAQSF